MSNPRNALSAPPTALLLDPDLGTEGMVYMVVSEGAILLDGMAVVGLSAVWSVQLSEN